MLVGIRACACLVQVVQSLEQAAQQGPDTDVPLLLALVAVVDAAASSRVLLEGLGVQRHLEVVHHRVLRAAHAFAAENARVLQLTQHGELALQTLLVAVVEALENAPARAALELISDVALAIIGCAARFEQRVPAGARCGGQWLHVCMASEPSNKSSFVCKHN